ncbi:MAG: response regulator transcription factor [Alcanivoracaceae bacterium]|nr:response regulator transcription factor [Alcanivoracaceae bacterium]
MPILIVEDNKDILANVADYLSMHGFAVDCAQDGLTALHLLSTNSYELVVLDLMLPGVNGLEICHRARRDMGLSMPVLMLTAKDTLEDKLSGFEHGADDYLVKPFSLAELLARVRAVILRSRGGEPRRLQVQDLLLDLEKMEVSRDKKPISLNRTSMKILEILMRQSPSLVKREIIEEAIWGDDPPSSDSLRSHIHYIRAAIDKPFEKKLLHTRHGMGYVLK